MKGHTAAAAEGLLRERTTGDSLVKHGRAIAEVELAGVCKKMKDKALPEP